VGFGVALSLGWHFLWSARTPKGQPPLTYLQPSDADQFKREFDRVASNSRMVLLLSRLDQDVCGGPPQPKKS
jgi:hypothetical protein